MAKKGGLGRGLGELLNMNELNHIDEEKEEIAQLKLEQIIPNEFQPRKTFPENELKELANSILELGVLQPIIVRKKTAEVYEIVAGERRWKASKIAGLEIIPAVVRQYSNEDVMQIALVENLQRADLNVIEIATAYKNLVEKCAITQESLAEKLGKSRTTISNTMRLLNLPFKVQSMLSEGLLNEGHARPLLSLTESTLQEKVAQKISEEGLNVRQVEEFVRNLLQSEEEIEIIQEETIEEKSQEKKVEMLYFNEAKERIQSFLGTKVNITKGKKKGKIEIEFYTDEDLIRIVESVLQTENLTNKDSSEENFRV